MKSYNKIGLIFVFLLSLSFLVSFGQCRTTTVETTKTIYTDRDTYIDSYNGDSNYGGKNYLFIGDHFSGYDHTFLHFDLSEIPEVCTKAYLSLDFYYISETIDISIYTTGNDWSEYGLTWINAPSEGSLVSHFAEIAEGKVYQFNISNFMESWSLNEISFIVKEFDYSETGYIQLSSKEGAYYDADKPHLLISYEEEVEDFDPLFIIFIIVGGIITIGIVVFLVQKSKTRKIKENQITEVHPSEVHPSYTISGTICSNCGAKMRVGTFCTKCGRKQN